jgi:sterol desaturase/sphingolipid hydroxylase (fatty acid hydroxylase superfamily)
MDFLIHYFSNISSLHRTLILAGGITFFWIIESAIPLFNFEYNKWKHAALNLFFTFTTLVVNFAFAILIVLTSEWCVHHHFGILQWITMPSWIMVFLGLLILDLIAAYTIHWLEHKVKWMWKFHMIHHADLQVDTTTANRHHPGESVFRAVFTILAVLIAGAPMWLVMFYQTISAILSQFNHANIKLSNGIDCLLRSVLVSPDMHKVHHHYVLPETDSNYGNIFSFWDRLFKTYRLAPANLRYGLDILLRKGKDGLKDQLKLPFTSKIN